MNASDTNRRPIEAYAKGQAAPIAYFTQLYPDLTQTFVYREVLALRARRIPVRTYSVWRPERANLSLEARPLMDETYYVFPFAWLAALLAHLRYLVTRPLRYFGTLAYVMTRPGEPLYNRWRSLLHFAYGLPAIRDMERAGIRHIHVHFAWSASSIALMAHRLLDIPYSLTLHSNEIYFDRLLLADKLRHARFVVTISEYNRSVLEELWPESGVAAKAHVIHCGLDPGVFAAACEPTEKSAAEPDGEFTIVGVGQLAPRKGFHVLVEACRHLLERGHSFRCHILGEGPERERLEALVRQYGLQQHVQMPGRIYQEELRQYLSRADVFALPCVKDKSGDQDGIPVVLMEAMAMELATLSTRLSGIPELIEDGRNGLLVSPEDARALADALQLLASDPAMRRQLGSAGRQTVIDHFNIHRSAEEMALLFERTVELG
jgi:glycosyltransferase involved in cell wall biosynthesis